MTQFELPFVGRARKHQVRPPRAETFREISQARTGVPGEAVWLQIGGSCVALLVVKNRRARRYVLRLRADGKARVTVPRGGSVAEALRFAKSNASWLETQLLKQVRVSRQQRDWRVGAEILFRGQRVRLELVADGLPNLIRFGTEELQVRDPTGDVRAEVEHHMRRLASLELPGRVLELAALHNVPVTRVTVRNQRSRWGSCSRHGTVSLNWRLVQAPALVRDYIILHELAHFLEMNHSVRFWRQVEGLCPQYKEAEAWLKANSRLLR